MVLVSSDLGGAAVVDQGYYKDEYFPSVISYAREFDEGSVGATGLLAAESDAEVGTSTLSTTRYLRTMRQVLASKDFREALEEIATAEAGDDEVSNFLVGRPQELAGGLDGFDLRISFHVLGIRAEMHVTVFRVDRVLGLLMIMGMPGKRVPLAVPRKLATVMAGRMRAELSPVVTRVPVISGTAQEGQTLTASKGAWLHKPTSYAYQWQRCNAAGEACAPIAAATAATYTATAVDVGSTIRVAVTARNSVGSATGVSAQTAVVIAAAPPVNTAPPAITGLVQQGQTLTGSAGAWTGNPTSFTYQWQRCDAAAASCANVANAIGQTYVLGAGDAGFRVRLAVTATNAVGATTAYSAATDVVP